MRLVLHSWTVDQAKVEDLPAIARETGWDELELRPVDFARAAERGLGEADLIDRLKATGATIACISAPTDWITTDGDAPAGLAGFTLSCRRAQALGAPRVMSRVHFPAKPSAAQIAGFRDAAAVAEDHGLRLALEFDSAAPEVNGLGAMRALTAEVAHPACGLLLDTYHLGRSGAPPEEIEALDAGEIAYVQFSDSTRLRTDRSPLDRVAPGLGELPLLPLLRAAMRAGYAGPLSFEAPHRDSWARAPHEVAADGLARTRSLIQAL